MEILEETIFSLVGKIINNNKDKEIAIAGLKRNISLFYQLNRHNHEKNYNKSRCGYYHIIKLIKFNYYF
jgi:hypothetical protein